jgi:hypothetical protein
MAAIDPNGNLIFVHIYRTGGSTIRRLLGLRFGQAEIHAKHCLGAHARAHFCETLGQPEVWDRAFKFTMVRNPFSWLVSTYNYVLAHEAHTERPIALKGFGHYLRWVAEVGLKQEHPLGANCHARLFDFIHDADGNLLVDFVGRFEQYERDVRFICNRAGLPGETIPKTNASRYQKTDYREYYAPEDVELVKRVWAKDLGHFGYRF